ncbi:replication initiation protein [Pleionea litopenaei]
MVSWLIFDLDHNNPWIWQDKDLPSPNIVVTNRENGHSHLFYAIPPVCTSENARSKPIRYMKAVYEAMASKLGADPSYSGPVAKTPGHPWWITSELHNTVFELGELADYLDLEIKPLWSKGPDYEGNSHSRHCLLFEDLRFYAYSIVTREKREGSFFSFVRLLEAKAFEFNNFKNRGFEQNLTVAQVKATVKSVSRWTWDRYTGSSRCNRGVMKLDKSLSVAERQKLSALRTHERRIQATKQKILSAYRYLSRNSIPITFTALSERSGVTRQTISKYKDFIESLSKNEANKTSEGVSVTHNRDSVKYGTHQITALCNVYLFSSELTGLISIVSVHKNKKPPD